MVKFLIRPSLFIYFSKIKNIFFIFNFLGVFYFKLNNFFFYSKLDILKFLFFEKNLWSSFLAVFKYLYIRFFFLFFLKIKLKGLGYRVKHLSVNLVRVFMGFTNFFYIHIPFFVFIKARRRRLFLSSFNKNFLMTIFLQLFFLKEHIPYKLRGFFYPKQIILMKPGKKRF